jgi:LysM repeat protein
MSRLLAPALLLVPLCLAAGPPSSAPVPGRCGSIYIVVRGDTLYSIARRCRSTVAAIAGASQLADPRRIEVGEPLVIPGRPARIAVAEPGKPEPRGGAAMVYGFRPTDTLYSLARWARVSVPALLAANPGINPHKIEIGDPIRLPAGAVWPEPARARERGPAPVQATLRRYEPMMTPPPPPPPERYRPEPPRAAPPPPPPRHKPDDDEPDTEGM